MTIHNLWLIAALIVTSPVPSPPKLPKPSVSHILVVKERKDLPPLDLFVSFRISEEIAQAISLEQFAKTHLNIEEQQSPATNELTIKVTVHNFFRHPKTNQFEPTDFVLTINQVDKSGKKEPELELMMRKGKVVIGKPGRLDGYRIGLENLEPQRFDLVPKGLTIAGAQSLTQAVGWALETEREGQGDQTILVPTDRPTLWLKAQSDDFSVHLAKGKTGPDRLVPGQQILVGNDLVFYQFIFSQVNRLPPPASPPKDSAQPKKTAAR